MLSEGFSILGFGCGGGGLEKQGLFEVVELVRNAWVAQLVLIIQWVTKVIQQCCSFCSRWTKPLVNKTRNVYMTTFCEDG